MSGEEILDQRKNKFLKIGRNKGFISNPENLSTLESKKNNLEQFYLKNKKIFLFHNRFFTVSCFFGNFFFYKAPQHCLNFLPVASHLSFLEIFWSFFKIKRHFGLLSISVSLFLFSGLTFSITFKFINTAM
jgi:hypothetical protein